MTLYVGFILVGWNSFSYLVSAFSPTFLLS